ncbi:flavin reductase family protein [Candidatus Margulisiibacteriota bacterium]
MTYKQVSINKAYRLINTGPLVLVSTTSKKGIPNIAPIAWCTPAELSPTRVLLVMAKEHKTTKNIKKTKKFIVSIPHKNQVKLVLKTGEYSGNEIDKFKKLKMKTINGKKVKTKIPDGVIGYIECKVWKIVQEEDANIVIGDTIYAAANPKAFKNDRLLSEKKEGKTLHHLGSKKFITTGGKVL